MNARDVRDELLGQHAALRTQIARTRGDIEAWSRGELESLQMRKEVDDLSSAMRKHNLREEELLGDMFRLGDGRDPGRVIMDDRHRDEHAELNTALALKGAAMDVEPAAWEFVMKQLLEQLLEHMTNEEKFFINADVLRDP
jgi:iron-sulfur cluster repair protein YtfE (RIC family)